MPGKGMSAPMETTEFGILYDQKPLSVTGYYKYKAGPEYYDNKEPMPDGKDSMAISAVLYEVESETETLMETISTRRIRSLPAPCCRAGRKWPNSRRSS